MDPAQQKRRRKRPALQSTDTARERGACQLGPYRSACRGHRICGAPAVTAIAGVLLCQECEALVRSIQRDAEHPPRHRPAMGRTRKRTDAGA